MPKRSSRRWVTAVTPGHRRGLIEHVEASTPVTGDDEAVTDRLDKNVRPQRQQLEMLQQRHVSLLFKVLVFGSRVLHDVMYEMISKP